MAKQDDDRKLLEEINESLKHKVPKEDFLHKDKGSIRTSVQRVSGPPSQASKDKKDDTGNKPGG